LGREEGACQRNGQAGERAQIVVLAYESGFIRAGSGAWG
jgi:hypothetical protein